MRTFDSLPDNWQEIILDNMSGGKLKTEVLKLLGISPGAHKRFYEENEEYAMIFDQGKLLSEAWWDETGRNNIGNKHFNHGLYIFIMKSVFKRRDNHGFQPPARDEFADNEERTRIKEKYKTNDAKALQ